jgi:hypothetical protein
LFNFPAFDAAAKILREAGHEVFSPADRDRQDGFDPASNPAWVSGTNQPHDLAWYMAIDLPEVCRAEAIAVLPEWEQSEGARLEMLVALALKKKVIHL